MLPRFVYRVDSRPPEVIFAEGFRPWGDNYDYLGHLNGISNILAWTTGLSPSDAYISVSENDVDSLQFLRLANHETLQADYLWLYEIRPTHDFYSVMNTSRYYFREIINGRYNFQNPSIRDLALNSLIESTERHFVEREWVSTQPITPELIVSARRIDMRNFRNGLPIWDSEVINNENYQQGPSNPNQGVFTHPDIIDETMLDMTDGFQDNGNGFIASGGFLLLSMHSHFNNQKKRSINKSNKEYIQSYYLKNRFKVFKNKEIIHKKISTPISQKWPMIDVKNNSYKYKLTNYNYQTIYTDWAYLTNKTNSSPDLIYDQHGRIGYISANGLIFYSLAVPNINNWDYLMFKPGLINDISMQWDLKVSGDQKYLRLVSKKYPNLIIGYNKGYLILQKPNVGYDEIAIDWKNLENKNILTKSFINNNYEWLDLRWVWNSTTYYPTLNGGSYSSCGDQQIYFLREFNYILYVDLKTGNVYALTNKREDKDDWNWIKWEQIDRNEFVNLPTNIRRMWKIDYYDKNRGICKINSYYQGDILWIQTNSTNWGSYFTSKKTSDYSSKASIQHFTNWKQ